MDDLLVFYAGLDEEKFLQDISGECYLPPLKLEDGGEATFLETSFKITPSGRIRHWLKNENLAGAPPKTHRYAHFHSHRPPWDRAGSGGFEGWSDLDP